jgi:hypothetical protein
MVVRLCALLLVIKHFVPEPTLTLVTVRSSSVQGVGTKLAQSMVDWMWRFASGLTRRYGRLNLSTDDLHCGKHTFSIGALSFKGNRQAPICFFK